MTTKTIQLKRLMACVAIPLLLSILMIWLTNDIEVMYGGIQKPPFSPPSWIFPIIWILEAFCMGVSAYFITESRDKRSKTALQLYYLHVLLHAVWAVLMFRFALYTVSVVVLLVVWFLLLVAVVLFHTLDKHAGKLLMPCLVYLTYMGYLCMAVAMLN